MTAVASEFILDEIDASTLRFLRSQRPRGTLRRAGSRWEARRSAHAFRSTPFGDVTTSANVRWPVDTTGVAHIGQRTVVIMGSSQRFARRSALRFSPRRANGTVASAAREVNRASRLLRPPEGRSGSSGISPWRETGPTELAAMRSRFWSCQSPGLSRCHRSDPPWRILGKRPRPTRCTARMMVEMRGLEPLTPSLQRRCSPS